MAYLLDADVFIRAKNLHYGLDFCPAFWAWLAGENAAGRLFRPAHIESLKNHPLGWGSTTS